VANERTGRPNALVMSTAAAGTALSLGFPWFEFWGAGNSRWDTWLSWSPLGLPVPHGGSSLEPGTRSWGFLLLAVSCTTLALTLVATFLIFHYQRRETTVARLLVAFAAVTAVALPILEIVEARARPPFGDGPPLTFAWGAVAGIAVATVTAVVVLSTLAGLAVRRLRVALSPALTT